MSDIKKTESIKIYLACPSGIHTGGPECLHQLAYKLRQYGYDTIMWYYDFHDYKGIIVNPVYKHYNLPARKFLDICKNSKGYCIIPEAVNLKNSIKELKSNGITPIIWWLSVVFYHGANGLNFPTPDEIDHDTAGLKNMPDVVHLVHSAYCNWFVRERIRIPENKNIYYINDYLRDEYLADEKELNLSSVKRFPIVLFNPKKGIEFTKKIYDYAKNKFELGEVIWVPVINMSPTQIVMFFRMARLYIDFGFHPGMDHLPREAGACGCCIITNKQGSAAFYDDVPLPDEYKFNDKEDDIPVIVSMIGEIINNYDKHIVKFASYRDFVRSQKRKFETDIIYSFARIIGFPSDMGILADTARKHLLRGDFVAAVECYALLLKKTPYDDKLLDCLLSALSQYDYDSYINCIDDVYTDANEKSLSFILDKVRKYAHSREFIYYYDKLSNLCHVTGVNRLVALAWLGQFDESIEESLASYVEKKENVYLIHAAAVCVLSGRIDLTGKLIKILPEESSAPLLKAFSIPNQKKAVEWDGFYLDVTVYLIRTFGYTTNTSRWINLKYDDVNVLKTAGMTLYKIGYYNESLVWILQALEYNTDDEEMLFLAGSIYYICGNKDKVREYFSRCQNVKEDISIFE